MTLEQLLDQYGMNPNGSAGPLTPGQGNGYYQQQSEGQGPWVWNNPRLNQTMGRNAQGQTQEYGQGTFLGADGRPRTLIGQYFNRGDGQAANPDDVRNLLQNPDLLEYDPEFGFNTPQQNFIEPRDSSYDLAGQTVRALTTAALGYGAGATAGLWGGGAGASGGASGSGVGGGAGSAGGYGTLPTMAMNPAAPALNPMATYGGMGGGFGAAGSAGGGLFGGATPSVSQLAGNALGAPGAAPGMFGAGGAQSLAQIGANAVGAGSGMLGTGAIGGGLLGTIRDYASGMLDNATSNPLNTLRGINGLTSMVQGIRGQDQPSNGGGKQGGGSVPHGTVQRPQYTPNPYTQQQLQQYQRTGF